MTKEKVYRRGKSSFTAKDVMDQRRCSTQTAHSLLIRWQTNYKITNKRLMNRECVDNDNATKPVHVCDDCKKHYRHVYYIFEASLCPGCVENRKKKHAVNDADYRRMYMQHCEIDKPGRKNHLKAHLKKHRAKEKKSLDGAISRAKKALESGGNPEPFFNTL